MRALVFPALSATFAALLTWALLAWASPGRPPRPSDGAAAPTIDDVRRLSSLTTLGVDVSDVLVAERRGRTGGNKAVLVVRGQVLVGVDLSAATFDRVDHDRRRAVLRLPPPAVQAVRLDPVRTRLLGVWADGLWAIAPGGREADAAAVNAAYRDAAGVVAAAADDPARVADARVHAERVLRTFVEGMGWTLDVRWASPR